MSNVSGRTEDDAEGPSTFKRIRTSASKLRLRSCLESADLRSSIHYSWSKRINRYDEEHDLSLCTEPFEHGEIRDLTDNDEYIRDALLSWKSELILEEKSSDLFKFKQSNDLQSLYLTHLQPIREFFETDVFQLMKDITRLPLNGKVHMFISKYTTTDFLLCHDDELESRRIAFIWYLTEEWDSAYGGTLDLFSAHHAQPLNVVKSIVPRFNKFVFFNVTYKSFHQVSEIVAMDVERVALSGWFYGDPLKRPFVTLPPLHPPPQLLQTVITNDNRKKLKNFVTEEYLDESNYPQINSSLEEYSIAKLKSFLLPQKHEEITTFLSNTSDQCVYWKKQGPPNLCSFHYNKTHTPSPDFEKLLMNIFHSKPFYEFLEKITEYDIISSGGTKVVTTIRRFQHKDYILLKTVECPKQIGENDTEVEEEEGSDASGTDEEDDITYETEDEKSEETEQVEMEIDAIYYFGDFSWSEYCGGQTVYVDKNGQQLLRVIPEPNTLSVIVREADVSSYVSYVNCKASTEKFFVLHITLKGFQTSPD